LIFDIQPTDTIVAEIRYQYRKWGEYGFTEGTLSDKAHINVVNNTSIWEIDLDRLSIYPNPCYETAIIESVEETEAQLFDLQGKLLQKFLLRQGRNTISLSNLTKGIYFLRTEKNSLKIVKQ